MKKYEVKGHHFQQQKVDFFKDSCVKKMFRERIILIQDMADLQS
jgi:hypothetical protein